MRHEFDLFLATLNVIIGDVAALLPRLLLALLILLAGAVAARIIRAAFRRFLKLAHFDKLATQSGVEDFLRQGEIRISVSELLARLVYWLALMMVVVLVADSLGLGQISQLFKRVVLYLPNIIIAVLVLLFGTLLARSVNGLTTTYLKNLGVTDARTLGNVSEYAVQIFVIFLALEQLEIGPRLLTLAFAIGFGALGLALALAFGLGGQEWAAGILNRRSSDKQKRGG